MKLMFSHLDIRETIVEIPGLKSKYLMREYFDFNGDVTEILFKRIRAAS